MSLRTRNSNLEPDIDISLDRQNNVEYAPFIRLWAAVFAKGLRDYCEARAAGRNSPKSSAWYISQDNSPGSFLWLCRVFDLDPDHVKVKVEARIDVIANLNASFSTKKKNNE